MRKLPAAVRRQAPGLTAACGASRTGSFIRGVRLSLAASAGQGGLADRVNTLLLSPQDRREWPLGFYSRERLFSVEARLGWVEPDLGPLPLFG